MGNSNNGFGVLIVIGASVAAFLFGKKRGRKKGYVEGKKESEAVIDVLIEKLPKEK